MINWLIDNPAITGILTTLMMWGDWLLTLAQERERKRHYYEHYKSYPIDTIEGNPILRKDVSKFKLFSLKHITAAILFGVFIILFLKYTPTQLSQFYLGFFWGIFLIVITQHVSNLIAYRISRKGIHGKIWMHLRTGYYIQAGRYFAIALLLLVLSVLVGELVLYGITLAAFVSSLRMFIWVKKVPEIDEKDSHPEHK